MAYLRNLKRENINVRVRVAGQQASHLMNYYNHRFNPGFVSLDGSKRDKLDGEDWWTPPIGPSDQCKIRNASAGVDVIYEPQQIDSESPGTLLPPYRIKEGRDAHGKSKYTHCMPISQDGVQIVFTSDLKLLYNTCIKKWAEKNGFSLKKYKAKNGVLCLVVVPDDEYMKKEWFDKALATYNKSIDVYQEKGIRISFKIDEGRRESGEKAVYGKLIAYISPSLFKNFGFVKFRPGESYDKPETWHPTIGEKIEDFLPKDKHELQERDCRIKTVSKHICAITEEDIATCQTTGQGCNKAHQKEVEGRISRSGG